MVGDCRCSAHCELRDSELGADLKINSRNRFQSLFIRSSFVQQGQVVLREGSGHVLIEVMVRVDESGRSDFPLTGKFRKDIYASFSGASDPRSFMLRLLSKSTRFPRRFDPNRLERENSISSMKKGINYGLQGIAHWRNLDGGSFLLGLFVHFQSGDGWVGPVEELLQPETGIESIEDLKYGVLRALYPIAPRRQILPCRGPKDVPISTLK